MYRSLEGKRIGQRIVVIGTTGSGKTTLANSLSARLNLPHVELDAIYWGPNWTPAPREEFRAGVSQALEGERWVVDGNYSKARDIIWPRADTIIWLNYSLPLILSRLTRRTFKRLLSKEVLWNGNQERWREQFGRDSLFLWALTTYRRRRRDYPLQFQKPEHAHLPILCFTSPRMTEQFLRK